MTVEDSHLLSVTEKSIDRKSCQCEKSTDGDEGNCSETSELSYNQRCWTSMASVLLTLTFIWAGLTLSGYNPLLSVYESVRPTDRFVPLRPLVPMVVESTTTEADVSKSMYFIIIEFGSNQNRTGPRELYRSVGQTVVRGGKAYLTSQITSDENGVVPMAHSVGRLMHPRPLRTKHRGVHLGEQTVVSFHTSFVFSINNLNKDREATGDGFAFVMVPSYNVLGSGGGYLGVMNSTYASNTFAVEFDIWRNSALQDISNNHVGINVNSMVSVAAANAGYWSEEEGKDGSQSFKHVDLTGGMIQAWIDYDGRSQDLTVSISPELGSKPLKPLLSKRLDLTEVFQKYMYAGFSAATGEFSAKHIIHSWSFEKHVNSHERKFAAPIFRNPSSMRGSQSQDLRLPALSFPLGPTRCSDVIHQWSASLSSVFTDFSRDFLSEAKELSKLWPFVLLGFLVGLTLMLMGPSIYQACVACLCAGPVDCYESIRELQQMADPHDRGQFILVLSEPQAQQHHPKLCSVV